MRKPKVYKQCPKSFQYRNKPARYGKADRGISVWDVKTTEVQRDPLDTIAWFGFGILFAMIVAGMVFAG